MSVYIPRNTQAFSEYCHGRNAKCASYDRKRVEEKKKRPRNRRSVKIEGKAIELKVPMVE
jgi:hypothetical protein